MPSATPPEIPDPTDSQPTVLFPLTVDTDLNLTAQSLLRCECGGQIHSIQLELLPEKHEARLWVTLAAAAYGVAVHALILGLPAAQFGAVKTVRANVLPLAQAA